MDLWTIGHSTQPLGEFLESLHAHQVGVLADVRRFPASRRHPHFAQAVLSSALQNHGITYVHVPELGGRRPARADSRNTAWRNESFRGYADYMETAEFEDGIARLLDAATAARAAMMCAERLWWQCHRGLIADYLKARGHEVVHIVSAAKREAHPYTTAARIVDGRLSYEGLI